MLGDRRSQPTERVRRRSSPQGTSLVAERAEIPALDETGVVAQAMSGASGLQAEVLDEAVVVVLREEAENQSESAARGSRVSKRTWALRKGTVVLVVHG